jgi:hypothetical protein
MLFIVLDTQGLFQSTLCKALSAQHRTWEPESFWEYAWLASLVDKGEYSLWGTHCWTNL